MQTAQPTPFRRISARGVLAACCVLAIVLPTIRGCSTSAVLTSPLQRTVIDNERGSIYTTPWDGVLGGGIDPALSGIGAYVDSPKAYTFWQMQPNALKIAHGRFHVFKPSDDTTWCWFPYTRLRDYEASEVAAGRPPLFLTATYAGKVRPVLWWWSLGFPATGQSPTTDPSNWEYGVNVGDPRFVNFWISNYADPIMLHRYYDSRGHAANIAGPYPNEWIGLDEGAFNHGVYGVLDDNNHWVPGVQWDAPFPQGSAGMHHMFQPFFAQLKQLRRDIHVMVNLGGLDDWSYFQSDFANVDGLMLENLLWDSPANTSSYTRGQVYDLYTALKWFGAQNKVAVLRAPLDRSLPTYASDLRTAYAAYLIYRGNNFFFAPEVSGSYNTLYMEAPPSDYAAMKTALGLPVAHPVDQQAAGQSDPGYRLYSRQMAGGIVYLNYTGSPQTISLPAGQTYYDHNGNPVTSLTIPDLSGDWVTARAPAARPNISSVTPNSGPVSGGTTVTINGTNLLGVTSMWVNTPGSGTTITSFKVNSPTHITAVIPPGQLGSFHISAYSRRGGYSNWNPGDVFTDA